MSRPKAFALVAALVIIVGLPSLFFPFGRDQGIHAYVGSSWLQGKLPYRDVWVQKGPLHFIPHLFVSALFGRTMWGIRLFDLFWQLVTSWLIYIIARRRLNQRGALISVCLYLLTYYALDYWGITHTEGFLSPLVLLGVFLYERADSSRQPGLLILLSGFSIGFSPWVKQTALVQVAGLFIWVAWGSLRLQQNRLQGFLRRIAPLGIGVIMSSALVLLWMSAAGMLQPMLEISRYTFVYYPNLSKVADMAPLRQIILYGVFTLFQGLRHGLLAFPFLVGMAYLVLRSKEQSDWYGIAVLTGCGWVGVYTQGRLWDYQWVNTLPFMALIAANATNAGIDVIQQRGAAHAKGIIRLFVVGLGLALPALLTHGVVYSHLLAYVTGYSSEQDYLSRYSTSDFVVSDVTRVARYVREHTTSDDYVFVWGHYAAVYYLADRQNPTRFGMDPPLSLDHPKQREWQQECMQDLTAHPPTYVVVATADAITPLESETSKQQLANFPEFAALLKTEYTLDRSVGDFEVYKQQR